MEANVDDSDRDSEDNSETENDLDPFITTGRHVRPSTLIPIAIDPPDEHEDLDELVESLKRRYSRLNRTFSTDEASGPEGSLWVVWVPVSSQQFTNGRILMVPERNRK